LKGHGFTACGKMQMGKQEVSGHDFSRAVNATKQMLGFSPCEMFSTISLQIQPFSASCLAVPQMAQNQRGL
jgi:hypothetical protein